MRIHLLLTVFAYFFLGAGLTIENIGVKAGLSPELVLGIFVSTLVFFVIIVFTSMEKVKSVLFKKDKTL